MYQNSHPSKRGPSYPLKAPSSTIVWKVVRAVKKDNCAVGAPMSSTTLVSAAIRNEYTTQYPTMQWVAANKDTIGFMAFDGLRWAVGFAKYLSDNNGGVTYYVMEAEGYDPRPLTVCALSPSHYYRAVMLEANEGMEKHYGFSPAPAGTVACDVLRTRRVAATIHNGHVSYTKSIASKGV